MAAFSLALAACDALLGLGQYHDVACAFDCDAEAGSESGVFPKVDAAEAEATAVDEGGVDAEAGSDADADAPGDTGSVVIPDALLPTGHEIWAHWPMPNPDASIGPESSTALPHAMSYDAGADAASAVVLDTVTNLTWSRTALPAASYDLAWKACLGLGASYRVPTRIELVSLIDFTQPSGAPTLDPVTFLDAGAVRTWTSSAVAGSTTAYWTVDFATGLTVNGIAGTQVLCVSGGTTP